jgi:hypothetical protein
LSLLADWWVSVLSLFRQAAKRGRKRKESMEMFDADQFLNGLNRQVEEEGGDAIVTIVLRSGARYMCAM